MKPGEGDENPFGPGRPLRHENRRADMLLHQVCDLIRGCLGRESHLNIGKGNFFHQPLVWAGPLKGLRPGRGDADQRYPPMLNLKRAVIRQMKAGQADDLADIHDRFNIGRGGHDPMAETTIAIPRARRLNFGPHQRDFQLRPPDRRRRHARPGLALAFQHAFLGQLPHRPVDRGAGAAERVAVVSRAVSGFAGGLASTLVEGATANVVIPLGEFGALRVALARLRPGALNGSSGEEVLALSDSDKEGFGSTGAALSVSTALLADVLSRGLHAPVRALHDEESVLCGAAWRSQPGAFFVGTWGRVLHCIRVECGSADSWRCATVWRTELPHAVFSVDQLDVTNDGLDELLVRTLEGLHVLQEDLPGVCAELEVGLARLLVEAEEEQRTCAPNAQPPALARRVDAMMEMLASLKAARSQVATLNDCD